MLVNLDISILTYGFFFIGRFIQKNNNKQKIKNKKQKHKTKKEINLNIRG